MQYMGSIRKMTLVITARKRSLRRLCFYTCLSVILLTGGSANCMLGYPPPFDQRQAPAPRSRHPPPGANNPLAQCMLGDTGKKRAERTGMQSCFPIIVKPCWQVFKSYINHSQCVVCVMGIRAYSVSK